MRLSKYLFLILAIGLVFSCSDDDRPQTEDPNLFVGVWKLESTVLNGSPQVLTDCDKESSLILFLFSEADPVYNAEVYVYEANENDECVLVQEIIEATWLPVSTFDANGIATPEVPLSYVLEDTPVRLLLSVDNNLLTVEGEMPMNGEMMTISKTYRQVRQEI